MTAHNPAMSFWPLERQLIDGTKPSDQDCREMREEARRMDREIAELRRQVRFLTSTHEALDRVRDGTFSRIHDVAASNAMGNLSHAMQDAEYAERRAGE